MVGTLDTLVLAWLITGDFHLGLKIGGAEVMTKMILYYLHERTWYKVKTLQIASSKIRHLLKTITWRIIGTLDTIILGWIISGEAVIGITVGGFELITKMILYYLHERIWYKTTFGLDKN